MLGNVIPSPRLQLGETFPWQNAASFLLSRTNMAASYAPYTFIRPVDNQGAFYVRFTARMVRVRIEAHVT